MIDRDETTQFGTAVWKYIYFDGWNCLRYEAIFYSMMAGGLMGVCSGAFFAYLPDFLAASLSVLVIIWCMYMFFDSYKTGVLGPSIYSNGISLVSKNPLRYHGRFVRFSEIKLVKIGLDDSAFDLAFLQRYLDGPGSKVYKKAEEAMEDMFDTILLELRSGEIVEFVIGACNRGERIISILKERNVEYVVSQDVQKWMDSLSDDWEG